MEKKENLKQIKQVLEWMNLFVDYIQEANPDLYNRGCEYADFEEEQNLLIKKHRTDEQKKR